MNAKDTETFSKRFRCLKSAQKRSKGVPVYTLYINRPVGRLIAAASPQWVTPNVLTGIGAFLTYLSMVLLMFFAEAGLYVQWFIGVLLIVGFFFDSADGQLARLRRQGSLSGEWLDHVLDSGRIALIHIATLWFLIRNQVASPTVAVGVSAFFALAAVTVFYGGTLFEKLLPIKTHVQHEEYLDGPVRRQMLLRSVLLLPIDYGILCWSFVLIPWPRLFFLVYGVLCVMQVVGTSMLLLKWYRRLRLEDVNRRVGSDKVDQAQ